jgi:hypothetical protein
MLALLQSQTHHVPGWLQVIVAVLAALQSVAIIGGIIAALYRFRREKPHKARLQPTISGVAATKDGIRHLQVEVSAENVGQVPIALDKAATLLLVSSRRTGDAEWTLQELRNVLEQQDEIQPGEKPVDQQWFEMPEEGEVAFKLDLSVAESEEDVSIAVEVVNLLVEGNTVSTESENG